MPTPHWGAGTPKPIATSLPAGCRPGPIMHANFREDWLRSFGAARGRLYNTLTLPCECVIRKWLTFWLPYRYGVEVGRTCVVEMEMTSLHAVPTNPRVSSFSAPWPTLSLQTTGRLTLRGPASTEVDREETFPSPESPMADDGRPTKLSLTGGVPPSVTSRGGELLALTRVRDRVSMLSSRYLTDWVCVCFAKNLLDHAMTW